MQVVSQQKLTRLAQLEQLRQALPQGIRIVAALIQESLAELVSPLLMIGLILSMANFLLHDSIFTAWSGIPFIWALVQCVAIDANLGVMLVRSVRNFHAGEWAKGIIYLLISFALLFVAAVIFDVEAIQSVIDHAIGLPIPIEWLTMLRSAAIVALVATVQLETVSLQRHKAKITSIAPVPPPTEPNTGPIRLVPTWNYGGGETGEIAAVVVDSKRPEMAGNEKLVMLTGEQLEKLNVAFKHLCESGDTLQTVSVDALQRAARVRREAVSTWLKLKRDEWEKNQYADEPEVVPAQLG